MIRIVYITVTLCLLVGCASEPPSAHDVSTAATRARDVPVILTATGWLDTSDTKVQAKAETCHMLRTALADSTHSWLWLEIDLPEHRHIRVLGRGALALTLIDGDGTNEVRDAGLFVALADLPDRPDCQSAAVCNGYLIVGSDLGSMFCRWASAHIFPKQCLH